MAKALLTPDSHDPCRGPPEDGRGAPINCCDRTVSAPSRRGYQNMKSVLEGPAWAPHGLDVRAGRFPLSVEAHLMNMTARLVPGATTVTTNARYYALHGLVALEAQRQKLDLDGAYRLLRRSEVVVAGASIAHPDPIAGTPHGYDAVLPQLHSQGYLDVGQLSVPQSGYANPRSGFLGPYLGSELTLGILASTTLEPGPRAEDRRSSFGLSRAVRGPPAKTGLRWSNSKDTRSWPSGQHGALPTVPGWLNCFVESVSRSQPDSTPRGAARFSYWHEQPPSRMTRASSQPSGHLLPTVLERVPILLPPEFPRSNHGGARCSVTTRSVLGGNSGRGWYVRSKD